MGQLVQLPGGKEKQGTTKKLAARTRLKVKEIEFIGLEEELEQFRLPKVDMNLWIRRSEIF